MNPQQVSEGPLGRHDRFQQNGAFPQRRVRRVGSGLSERPLAEDDNTVHVFTRVLGPTLYAERHSDQFNVTKAALSHLERVVRDSGIHATLGGLSEMVEIYAFSKHDEAQAARRIAWRLLGRRAASLGGGGRWGLLVDGDVHPRDEVWVLFGCAYPIILRPDGGRYRVVSPMYVHGLMIGEAVEGLTDLGAEGRTFRSRTYPISTIELV
jgi:hypothetical protein